MKKAKFYLTGLKNSVDIITEINQRKELCPFIEISICKEVTTHTQGKGKQI